MISFTLHLHFMDNFFRKKKSTYIVDIACTMFINTLAVKSVLILSQEILI